MFASPSNHPYSYLFDCGKASLLTISDVMRTKALFVTHTHVDHFINFDTLIRCRAGSYDSLIIAGPRNIARQVQAKLRAYTWNLIQANQAFFEVREILDENSFNIYRLSPPEWKIRYCAKVSGNRIFELDSISVDFCPLDHKIPSIAYRMQENDHLNIKEFPHRPGPWIELVKEAYRLGDARRPIPVYDRDILAQELFQYLVERPGYKVGYAMDHLGGGRNHELLEEFFFGLDELFIESFFRHADWEYARRHHHSTSYLSGILARKCQVKKLRLVHHSRRYLPEIPDLLEEGMAAFEGREPKYSSAPSPRYLEGTSCESPE